MFDKIPKEQKLTVVVCTVLALIFIVNTVIIILVFGKVFDMEDMESKNQTDQIIQENSREIERLQNQFKEFEKADTKNGTNASDKKVNTEQKKQAP